MSMGRSGEQLSARGVRTEEETHLISWTSGDCSGDRKRQTPLRREKDWGCPRGKGF